MNFTKQDIEIIKEVLSVAKIIGIEGLVFSEGQARGARPSLDAAILTTAKLSIDDVAIGIGRTGELEKRLGIFGANVTIDLTVNGRGDASMLTLSAGKSKMQYRLTSPKLMRYPKSNEDEAFVHITLSKEEVQQISQASKSMASENMTVHVSRVGVVKIECSDATNDRFEVELEAVAAFTGDAESTIQQYVAGLMAGVLDAAGKDGEVVMQMGFAGSIAVQVKNHTLLVLPQLTEEE